MPQVRFSTSALGNYLAPKIESFIKANAQALLTENSASFEDGAEALAHAISYGVSLAWGSPIVQGAFAVGIVPPPVPPATVTAGQPVWGTLMYNVLKPQVIET